MKVRLFSSSAPSQWLRWPVASLRTYLHIITLAAIVPLALLTAWLVGSQMTVARQQLAMGLQQGASALALMIEREQAASVEALNMLAKAAPQQPGDLPAFRRMVHSFASIRPAWRRVVLIDPRRGEVLSEPVAGQDELGPFKIEDSAHPASPDLAPRFSGLIPGERPGQWLTRLTVPVLQAGQLRYQLAVDIDARYWQQLIAGSSVPQDGFVTIYDGAHMVVARTLNPSLHIGRPLVDGIGKGRSGDGGFHKLKVRQEGDAYVAWKRIPLSDWGVRIGVSAGPLDRNSLVAFLAAAGAGVLSLAAGLVLSRLVATRVNKPLGILAQGRASSLKDKDITVFEIAMLRNAMLAAEQQRDLARQRLEAKAAEFETLFMLSPIGLSITLDQECSEVSRNPAKMALFDMTPGKPHTFDLVANGQVLSMSQHPLQRAARGEQVHNQELEVRHRDGRVLRLLAHAVPLLDLQGRPRGAIATFVDITERVQAQDKLMHAQSRLQDNQHFIELAQEAGDVGFLDYQVRDNRVTLSSGLARLFGLGRRVVETQWDEWLAHIDPQDAKALSAVLEQAWRDHQEQVDFTFRLLDEGMTDRWLSSRVVTMYDLQGQPMRIIGALVDVTVQQQIERERNRLMTQEQAARHDAERANRAKDEFLAMLGHELRNPLSAISAAIEVLNRISGQGDQAARVRMIISRQTRHLARLMDDLLDVARVIANKIHLSLAAVSLGATVHRLVNTMKMAGLSQTLELDVDDVWVRADTMRLEQIINNLITNAAKYSPQDKPIKVIVKAHGDMARLQVIDQGQGIPPALLPHIFDLFVQGERTIERRQGGMGIGLTLVKSLVELHKGHIDVSTSEHGSIFTVDLPLAEPDRAFLPGAPSVAAVQRKVVVVEDNEDAREAVHLMLEIKGHDVLEQADGQAGLACILEARPHLALVDIGLPGLSGYEVARRAREEGFTGWMVALSGYGQQQDVQMALESGFDFHMVKPLDEGMLDDFLARAPRKSPSPELSS